MTTLGSDGVAARRVVVGMDGSDCSWQALDWAATHARTNHLVLELVHVDGVESELGSLLASRPSWLRAEQVLAQVVDQLAQSGVEASVTILVGSPAHALLRCSEEAALLVLGAWGNSSRGSLLLGTVAQHCARHVRCPLVLVPAVARAAEDAAQRASLLAEVGRGGASRRTG